MVSEGPNYGTSFTQSASPFLDDWADLANLGADDATDATCDLAVNGLSETISITDFGLTTEGAIQGVFVEIERHRVDNGGATVENVVRLIVGGAIVGDNKADTVTLLPTSATTASYGGPKDKWGLGLNSSQVNASTFGVSFRVYDPGSLDVAHVDFVRITVTYATGGWRSWFSKFFHRGERGKTVIATRWNGNWSNWNRW